MAEVILNSDFDELNRLRLWDFTFESLCTSRDLGDDVLTIDGSRDLTLYRQGRIQFFGVSYIDCPVSFHHAQFRLATDAERKVLSGRAELGFGTAYCILVECQDDGSHEGTYFVIAERVRVECRQVVL